MLLGSTSKMHETTHRTSAAKIVSLVWASENKSLSETVSQSSAATVTSLDPSVSPVSLSLLVAAHSSGEVLI